MDILKIFHITLLLAPQSVAPAEQVAGKVVEVSNSDTAPLLVNDSETIKVHLSEMVAPETNLRWGRKSKQAPSLRMPTENITDSTLLSCGQIYLTTTIIKDRYGRALGAICPQVESINKLMVQNGNTWVCSKNVAGLK